MMKRVLYTVVGLLLVVVAAVAGWLWHVASNSDALRQITLEQCVPGQRDRQQPAPCAEVNLRGGYVVFKDRNGPLQYLLMPSWKINGIESPDVLSPHTANFFWQAWQARRYLSEKNGAPLPDNAISLTINSRLGRSQNHLHIHISCLRPDVRKQLDNSAGTISTQWLPLPGGINGHEYLARRVTESELAQRSPFVMLAEEVENAREHMGRYGLAVVRQNDGSFVLLATERGLVPFNLASAEEIQDHDCAILQHPHQP